MGFQFEYCLHDPQRDIFAFERFYWAQNPSFS